MLWLLWVVGQQLRLTDCWLCSREKQEVGGQLKELKDQLEAEQYFTVILNNKLPLFSFPPELQTAMAGKYLKLGKAVRLVAV